MENNQKTDNEVSDEIRHQAYMAWYEEIKRTKEEYPIQDASWASRRWKVNSDGSTDYVDLSGFNEESWIRHVQGQEQE